VAALQAELAQPDDLTIGSITFWVLSQPAIRMPLHLHFNPPVSPGGTSIKPEGDACQTWVYEIIEIAPLGGTPAATSQSWFWTPEWQAGEREASDELRENAGRVFDTAEDFLGSFDV
jgi:hypothetical protein